MMMQTMIVSEDFVRDTLWDMEGFIDDDASTDSAMDQHSSYGWCAQDPSPSGPIHLQRSTRVRFSDVIQEHAIMSLDDLSDSELQASWYSSTEKKELSAKRNKVLARLERGMSCKEVKATYRGLECWTTTGAEDLSDNVSRVITAVMEEQDRQWRAGVEYDARLIALKSQSVTGSSVQRALKMAQDDECQARRLHQCEDQEVFVDGISWYRPQKRGNRRGHRQHISGATCKLLGKTTNTQKSWRTTTLQETRSSSSNPRRWVKGNRGRVL